MYMVKIVLNNDNKKVLFDCGDIIRPPYAPLHCHAGSSILPLTLFYNQTV